MKTASRDEIRTAPRTWVVFVLGPYTMCASALEVEGIVPRPAAIVRLPLTPDYALGAFLFRGRGAAAISLRRKLKLRDGEDRASGPFIVVRLGEAAVAFWVDEVRDVIDEKDAQWRPMPSMFEGGLFERFAIRENELILQTSFAALRDAQVEFESLAGWAASQTAEGGAAARDVPDPVPSSAAAPAAPVAGPEPEDEPSQQSAHSPGNHSDRAPLTLPIVTAAHAVPTTRSAAAPPRVGAASGKTDGRAQALPRPPRADTRGAKEKTIGPAPIAMQQASLGPVEVAEPRRILDADPRESAPPRSSRVWLVAAVGIGLGVIVALGYQLRPALPHDRATVAAATASTLESPRSPALPPAAAPRVAAAPSTALDSDGVTVTIEHGRDRVAKTRAGVAPGVAARGSTVHIQHTVVAGDTLWKIAKKEVGDPFRYPELAKLSKIANPDLIWPGDVIRIEIHERR